MVGGDRKLKKAASLGIATLVAGLVAAVVWQGLARNWGRHDSAYATGDWQLGAAGPSTGCGRPYSDDNPWNTPISLNSRYHPESEKVIRALRGRFGSNPNAYTYYPVYGVTSVTPNKKVLVSGVFSDVVEGGNRLLKQRSVSVDIPIPEGARSSRGSDGQIIVINTETGDEWGLWRASTDGRGFWRAVNGYHYNTRWNGVPPAGFGSRGAKVPYLAGLIRKCEIERGYIDHAIAFTYDYPCNRETCSAQGFPFYVYPATGSDGKGNEPGDFPEGTRLQLTPAATEQDIRNWCGQDRTCRVIVKGLQEYGMITVDNSGHPKIYAEDDLTAHWNGVLADRTVSRIPYSAFRVVDWHK